MQAVRSIAIAQPPLCASPSPGEPVARPVHRQRMQPVIVPAVIVVVPVVVVLRRGRRAGLRAGTFSLMRSVSAAAAGGTFANLVLLVIVECAVTDRLAIHLDAGNRIGRRSIVVWA